MLNNNKITCGIILENHRWFDRIPTVFEEYNCREFSLPEYDHKFIKIILEGDFEIIITVAMGASIVASMTEELRELGVSFALRIGTTGALTSKISLSEVVFATAAVRDEGTSRYYLPIEAPALAHRKLNNSLSDFFSIKGIPNYQGMVVTTDGRWKEDIVRLEVLGKLGALAVEMETAGILAVGMDRALPVMSLSIVSDHPLQDDGDFVGVIKEGTWENLVTPRFMQMLKSILEWLPTVTTETLSFI